ncbi:MAG TPA: hypothetical protein VLD16_10860 [Gaiellaceae bacterium]|nr:hypothetical protein [Gaiellaceae bacterium]
MILRRALSAAPLIAVVAAALAVGTAAAPDRGGSLPARYAGPRLVVTPARLARASRVAPGDRIERLVELRTRGRGGFAAVYFVARARVRSRLDRNRRNGLRIALLSCPRPWRKRGRSSTCPAGARVVLSQRPLVGRSRLRGVRLVAGRAVHLELRLSLPAHAGTALQRQATTVAYSFVGSGRR